MLSELLSPLIDALKSLSTVMPLPLFTAIGAFVEELIAPIPSPLVMTLAGTLAASQAQPVAYLFWLAFVGSIGKTIGSYLIYIISDKAEDFVLNKAGKYLGVTHKEVESIGKHLNKGWRDHLVLFLLRAIPIIPTAPVSIVCGLIKMPIQTYLIQTFVGTLVRNLVYLYLGYTSLGALEEVNEGFDQVETIGYVIVLALIGIGFFYIYRARKSNAGMAMLEKWSKKDRK